MIFMLTLYSFFFLNSVINFHILSIEAFEFQDRFLMTYSIFLIDVVQFTFSISFCVIFNKMCCSRYLFISYKVYWHKACDLILFLQIFLRISNGIPFFISYIWYLYLVSLIDLCRSLLIHHVFHRFNFWLC